MNLRFLRAALVANLEEVTELSSSLSARFAHCVRAGVEPKTTGEEGLKDLLAMEAIYRAAGAPIA